MAVYGGVTGATPFKARDAYYRREYGVSYGQYRRQAVAAKTEGMSGKQTRGALRAFKSQGADPKASIEQLLQAKRDAKQAYQTGTVVQFDSEYWGQFDLDDSWLWYH